MRTGHEICILYLKMQSKTHRKTYPSYMPTVRESKSAFHRHARQSPESLEIVL